MLNSRHAFMTLRKCVRLYGRSWHQHSERSDESWADSAGPWDYRGTRGQAISVVSCVLWLNRYVQCLILNTYAGC
jgi:hypothetical protein